MEEEIKEESLPKETLSFFVAVKFNGSPKSFFFATNDDTFEIGEECVVETVRGIELGVISSNVFQMSEYSSSLELKPILRHADDEDKKMYKSNIELAKDAFRIFVEEANAYELDMNLISAEYTLDRTKVVFTYLANERVDFRELLKSLAAKLHCRIELKQVGTRDKAKMIGGIGICGMPLCCATFLNEFDGISINRAKNQMLSLNIPKLSGHCGKLICCLKYEDDAYTDLKKDYPKIGQRINYNNEQYRVSSMNVLTRTIQIEKPDDIKIITLEQFNDIVTGQSNE